MDVEEARELLRRCQRDRHEAQEAAKTAQATVESAQLIIEGLLRRFPELSDDEQEWGDLSWEAEGQPRGDRAVLAVLQVAENANFTVPEMVDALQERGWLPESGHPANAVRTALERLRKAPESGVRKGRYNSGQVFYSYSEPQPERGYEEEPF